MENKINKTNDLEMFCKFINNFAVLEIERVEKKLIQLKKEKENYIKNDTKEEIDYIITSFEKEEEILKNELYVMRNYIDNTDGRELPNYSTTVEEAIDILNKNKII